MLDALRFVKGAVARKDLVPAMTHFRIEAGHVRSYDGSLAISSPVALDFDCTPQADKMVKAIEGCDGPITIAETGAGRLSIRSGKFRALVNTVQGEVPHPKPEGERFEFDGAAVLEAFKVVEPFIGNDASRPFTNGVLLADGSAYATNNTCLVQYWIGAAFPLRVNVPGKAIRHVLAAGEAPTHGQLTNDSITFHYADGRWIRSQLLDTEWPMSIIANLLDQPSNAVPLPDDFFKGLATITKLADGARRVYMMDGKLRTSDNPDDGAEYDVGLPCDGLYNMNMLGLLDGVVTSVDFARYPEPALFFGGKLRGAIVGMKM